MRVFIPVTPGRIDMLDATIAGYRATGELLLAVVNGRLYVPGSGEDLGLFYFIPIIATRFGLTAAEAMASFQWTILLLGTGVGILLSLRLFRAQESRVFAALGLIGVATLAFGVGDVYMIAPVYTAVVVPAAVYVLSSLEENRVLISLAVIGFFGAIANFASYFAAFTGLAFVLGTIYWSARPRSRQTKLWFVAALAAGFLVATSIFQFSISRRDSYVKSAIPAYEAQSRSQGFWVKAYMGLGFLTNPYVRAFGNDIAASRLAELAPSVAINTPSADRIMRKELVSVARQHPWFAIRTIAAKAGVVFLYLVVFVGAGLLARSQPGAGGRDTRAFIVAGLVSIIPGILWIPTVEYLSAAIALSVLYATQTIARARD